MDDKEAENVVEQLRVPGGDEHNRHWKDPLHVATTTWRTEAIRKLNRDPALVTSRSGKEDFVSIALVEIFLTDVLPEIHDFHGIFEVDPFGIWYYDGDGSVDDPIWRQHVIPWRYIKGVVMHQAS
jgi:hypothetical protein